MQVRTDRGGTFLVGGIDQAVQSLDHGQEPNLIDLCGYPHRSIYTDTGTTPRSGAAGGVIGAVPMRQDTQVVEDEPGDLPSVFDGVLPEGFRAGTSCRSRTGRTPPGSRGGGLIPARAVIVGSGLGSRTPVGAMLEGLAGGVPGRGAAGGQGERSRPAVSCAKRAHRTSRGSKRWAFAPATASGAWARVCGSRSRRSNASRSCGSGGGAGDPDDGGRCSSGQQVRLPDHLLLTLVLVVRPRARCPAPRGPRVEPPGGAHPAVPQVRDSASSPARPVASLSRLVAW